MLALAMQNICFASTVLELPVSGCCSAFRSEVGSGDVDSVCPTMGTRHWMSKLEKGKKLQLSKYWYPWYLHEQVQQ